MDDTLMYLPYDDQQNYTQPGREGSLNCNLFFFPKIFKLALTFIGLKTHFTFINFLTIVLIKRRGNFVYHYWGYVYIYPLKSLIYNIEIFFIKSFFLKKFNQVQVYKLIGIRGFGNGQKTDRSHNSIM